MCCATPSIPRGRFGGLKSGSVGTHAQRGRSGKKRLVAVNSKYSGGNAFDSIDERGPRRPRSGDWRSLLTIRWVQVGYSWPRGIESR